MKISLSMWAVRLPSAFSLPCWLSLARSASSLSLCSGFLDLALPSFLMSLLNWGPLVPIFPHRADNPFPQPARHISSPAPQFMVCHICMSVLWVLLHQAEPKSEGSTQLMLHAIARGTCLRFCSWEAPGLNLKTKSVLMQALVPKEDPSRADAKLNLSCHLR